MTLATTRSNPRSAAATMQRGTVVCGQQGRGSVQRWQKHQRVTGFQA